MTTIVYEYEIPDPNRPIPEEERGLGPSGELIAFTPPPVIAADVIGKTITNISTHLGTYGMGGPGFFGVNLGEGEQDNWLVVAIWGAGDWITSQGRALEDSFYDMHNRPKPWRHNVSGSEKIDEITSHIIGAHITAFEVGPKNLRIDTSAGYDFTITEDAVARPFFQGNGKPRAFDAKDDLRKAVFLSPTLEIWV